VHESLKVAAVRCDDVVFVGREQDDRGVDDV
jgi:hypothetical protein